MECVCCQRAVAVKEELCLDCYDDVVVTQDEIWEIEAGQPEWDL